MSWEDALSSLSQEASSPYFEDPPIDFQRHEYGLGFSCRTSYWIVIITCKCSWHLTSSTDDTVVEPHQKTMTLQSTPQHDRVWKGLDMPTRCKLLGTWNHFIQSHLCLKIFLHFRICCLVRWGCIHFLFPQEKSRIWTSNPTRVSSWKSWVILPKCTFSTWESIENSLLRELFFQSMG